MPGREGAGEDGIDEPVTGCTDYLQQFVLPIPGETHGDCMYRRFWIALTFSAAFLATSLLMAQTKPAELKAETFAIIYEPGPKWVQGRSIFDQSLQEHGQYMGTLLEQGHLLMGGPFSDSSGGMAIITAKGSEEANAILKNDPGVTKGVFTAKLRPWYVVFQKASAP